MEVPTEYKREKCRVVSASEIIGRGVVNLQDQKLGKVRELVIDAEKGRVYVVFSFGGFLGWGSKLFAMPWRASEFSRSGNKLVLNVDKQKLAGRFGPIVPRWVRDDDAARRSLPVIGLDET